jgi:hypothetical protein
MALISEPRCKRNFAQRLIGIEHELLRSLNALRQKPLMRWAPNSLPKRLTEMTA